MQGTESDPGVIPRSAEHLLSLLKLPEYSNAELSMSYLEIYNEKVYDLLQPKDQVDTVAYAAMLLIDDRTFPFEKIRTGTSLYPI